MYVYMNIYTSMYVYIYILFKLGLFSIHLHEHPTWNMCRFCVFVRTETANSKLQTVTVAATPSYRAPTRRRR